MTPRWWIALALAGFFFVTACDDSERAPEDPSRNEVVSRPSTDGAVTVLEASIQASFKSDAESVCALQTRESSAAVSEAMAKQGFVDEGATCVEAMLVLSSMIDGFGGVGYELDEVSVLSKSADGETVTLRATYTGEQSNHETYEVSYIDGQWLVSGDAETIETLSPAGGKQ